MRCEQASSDDDGRVSRLLDGGCAVVAEKLPKREVSRQPRRRQQQLLWQAVAASSALRKIQFSEREEKRERERAAASISSKKKLEALVFRGRPRKVLLQKKKII